MLQSPNFLYHWEIGPTAPKVGSDGLVPLTPWQVASRLASTLWETVPDDALLQAAQSGQLSTPAQVSAQVTRLLADPRAANGLFSFHEQWLFNFGSQGRDLTQPLTEVEPALHGRGRERDPDGVHGLRDVRLHGRRHAAVVVHRAVRLREPRPGALYGVSGPATGFAKVSLDPRSGAASSHRRPSWRPWPATAPTTRSTAGSRST